MRLNRVHAIRVRTLWIVVLLAAALCSASARAVRVQYTLSVQPKADHVHVTMLIQDDPDANVAVVMPVWVPGYYHRLDQYSGVSNVSFRANGQALTTAHPSAATWTTTHAPNEALTVDYDVKRFEYGFGQGDTDWTLGQMGVHIDKDSAFVHPGTACMYVDGHKDAPCTLKLDLPARWDAAVPLPRGRDGMFEAKDYDTLNDSPVQLGRFHRVGFTARGHGFEIITTGKCRVSDDTLTAVCKPIAEAATDLFEGWAPYGDYQFHFHFPPKLQYAGAGLEHRSSCVIVFAGGTNEQEFRGRGAHIISHEFFHAWNVKALRPEGLGPFDYQAATKTTSLWMAEGLTDYYAYLVGARAGLWTPESSLKRFAALTDEYRGSGGRNKTDLADSSAHVWEAQGSSSSGSGGTNYYTKGLLASWLLDIQIRSATKGAHSLDDAVRWMARKYAVTDKGYPPDALLTAIRETSGLDLSEPYKAYVHGTADLPFEKVLPLAGIEPKTVQVPVLMLGANMERGASEPKVVTVDPGSAADDAHIEPGDVLLKIDGEPVEIGRRPLLAGRTREVGDRVPVIVRRDNENQLITVIVKGQPATEYALVKDPTKEQRTVWQGIWASDRFASR